MNALFATSDNYSRAEAVIQRIDQITSAEESLLFEDCDSKVPLERIMCQRRLVESIRRAFLYVETIAEITLNLFVDTAVARA